MKTLRNFGYFNLLAGLPLGFILYASALPLMVPAGLLMLIAAWVYRNRPFSKDRQVFIGLAPLPVCVVLTVGLLVYSEYSNRPFQQTILVPAGYRGLVVIGYGVAEGQPENWEGDARLISLSSRGTATTQFKRHGEGSFASQYDKFYEVGTDRKRHLLPNSDWAYERSAPASVSVVHPYMYPGLDVLVCIIARGDSMSHYLDPDSGLLRPAYVRQVENTAATLGIPNYSSERSFSDTSN